MTNISKKQAPEVLALANLRNFFRKRKQDSRLEVAESIISALNLKIEALPLCDWLDAEKATQDAQQEEKPAKKSRKMPVDTMTGSTAAKAELMPVIETDQPVIVTSAQNNTEVTPVFNQLKALAEHLGAKLIILPVYYNKNAFDPHEESEQESFSTELRPYLVEDDAWLYARDCVRLAATAAVLPTAKMPINAAAMLNAGELFTMVASPKQQYKTLPTLRKDRTPKAWTSASCTGFNYKRGRAGIEAETEHVFGGTLFTRDDSGAVNSTNIRQARDGSIMLYVQEIQQYIHIDHQCRVSSCYSQDIERLSEVIQPPAVKLGDLHCEMYDPKQWSLALDFVKQVKPIFVAVDDVAHFSTRSHHNRNDSKHLYATRHESVENDLLQVINQLNELAELAPVYCTESNHNSAIDNWLNDTGVKIDYDSHNAKLYHLLKWLVMETLDSGETEKNALQVALEHADLTKLPPLSDRVTFGRMDKPKIGYIYDFSQHGHKGQNGTAGNPNQLKRLNIPLVTGHTHSPSILGGNGASVFTTGVTAKLNQGYNRGGASGWDHAHVMEHSNGECQLINTNPQV